MLLNESELEPALHQYDGKGRTIYDEDGAPLVARDSDMYEEGGIQGEGANDDSDNQQVATSSVATCAESYEGAAFFASH